MNRNPLTAAPDILETIERLMTTRHVVDFSFVQGLTEVPAVDGQRRFELDGTVTVTVVLRDPEHIADNAGNGYRLAGCTVGVVGGGPLD